MWTGLSNYRCCHMQDSQSVNCYCNYLIITIPGKLCYIIRLLPSELGPVTCWPVIYSSYQERAHNYRRRRPWIPAFSHPPGYCHTSPSPSLPHFNFYQHQALPGSQWSFIGSPGIYCLEILQGNSLGFLHTDVTMEY